MYDIPEYLVPGKARKLLGQDEYWFVVAGRAAS